jgi:hypothetical protein
MLAPDDQAAVVYLARKRAEGKPRREALRCLERRPSNVSCKALLAGQTHHHPGLVTSPLTGRFDHRNPMA